MMKVLIERDPGPGIRPLGGLIKATPGRTMFIVHRGGGSNQIIREVLTTSNQGFSITAYSYQ